MPYSVDNLFNAVAKAETGGQANPFIRTQVAPAGGSSAYGPAQLTTTTAKDYLSRLPGLFNKDDKGYLRRFVEQGRKFNLYGNEPTLKGYEPRFDYGGTGELGTTLTDRTGYTNVLKKIMGDMYSKSGNNITNFITRWRGVQDPGYINKVMGALTKKSEVVKSSSFLQPNDLKLEESNMKSAMCGHCAVEPSDVSDKYKKLLARLDARRNGTEKQAGWKPMVDEQKTFEANLKAKAKILKKLDKQEGVMMNNPNVKAAFVRGFLKAAAEQQTNDLPSLNVPLASPYGRAGVGLAGGGIAGGLLGELLASARGGSDKGQSLGQFLGGLGGAGAGAYTGWRSGKTRNKEMMDQVRNVPKNIPLNV